MNKKIFLKLRLTGLQRKLNLILIFTVTVFFSGLGFLYYSEAESDMNNELSELADFLAKNLAESLAISLHDCDEMSIRKITDSAMLEKQVSAIRLKSGLGMLSSDVVRDDDWNVVRTSGEISGNYYYLKTEDIVKDGEKLGVIEVYVTSRFMRKKLDDSVVRIFAAFVILGVLLFSVLFLSIRKWMIFPVRRLAGSVRAIALGQLYREVRSEGEDEIGWLASDVEKMRLAINDLTDNLRQQERLKKEMELARRIQTSLLPVLPDNFHPDFEITAAMLPAEQVGGDFYDISFDRSDNLWLAIGDVSGHGVTPGLIMMMAQTVHTTVAANFDCDARSAVVRINEILYKNVRGRLRESHFMTFTALKYLGGGQFQHAGAHLSMIVWRRKTGACELVRTRGVYLNFKKDISKATKNAKFSLEPGDILVLYTDGLTEAENPDGRMLDLDGFVRTVEKHACQEPEAMKEMIMADVIRWCDDNRADDMTLLIIKRRTEH